ncbi:Retrovirus-related Pol polyprotein from transposon RE1 [Vitis vinifera]|uniref:Retrovirus-related Pol polyprotein from transposon RE1 n=1 Tax=Vitis vinifera TaxID=29760 RepID=A0A438GKJ4_VITVI|nr:Retrovirus-related Pol polyprotein from transposon RE1 [Vitis vinifera]
MHSEFEMSMMGELNFFLGLQIKQLKKGTFINQAKYIRDLLKRFNMEKAKTTKTPMSSSIKLENDEKGKSVNSTMYRGMIGSLLYLTTSRPDIIYLKGTMDIGLWYPKGDNFELIGFSDADFADCKVERKSTSGTCHFLGHSLVSWHSKKQNSTSFSPFFVLWMAPRRETSTSRAQGKCPAKPSQPEQTEGSPKGEPIFPTLMRAFYSRVTYGLAGPVMSTVRGVEIRLSPESIYRILDIPSVGLQVCLGMGKPSAHNLTVSNRVLHHMICSILLPRGGHRDEVSYFEAFIVDLIMTGRRIHVRNTDFEAPTSYDTYDEQSLGRMKFEKAPDGS